MTKTVLIMAGGTGGHIFPGLALADELKSRGWAIHWLGTAEKMEAELVPKAGYDISFISVQGLRGKGFMSLLKAPFKIAAAIKQAIAIFSRVNPQMVVGMGGYASGPGGVAAKMKRIPLVLHEQNALPGLTNRLLAKVANKVLSGFDKAFDAQHSDTNKKYQYVGNPLRSQMRAKETNNIGERPLRLLVVGGSLGARVLNEQLPNAIQGLDKTKWQVVHQTGRGQKEAVAKAYKKLDGLACEVTEFIDDMSARYQWADIVICRSGALTVSELALVGLASILVPLPHAVDDHQTLNAHALVDRGGAILLPQKELESGKLITILKDFARRPEQLVTMSAFAKQAAKPNATSDVADICEQIIGHAA